MEGAYGAVLKAGSFCLTRNVVGASLYFLYEPR